MTALQREVLEGFFRREQRFFLTGGAALAEFHVGHRTTEDLDFFTTEDAIEDGERALEQTARAVGATLERVQTSPDFRRRLLRRGSESVLVDLVHDRVPQLVTEKPRVGAIRVDPAEEILVNKLCSLLSRSELRDLVDVAALEAHGISIEAALPGAARKDAGFSPSQLAWVLEQVTIGDDARIPGGGKPADVRRFLASLIERLRRAAYPG